jgi:hypothetical protein
MGMHHFHGFLADPMLAKVDLLGQKVPKFTQPQSHPHLHVATLSDTDSMCG